MDMVRAIQRVESEDVSIGLATQTPPGRDTCDKMSHISRTTPARLRDTSESTD